MFYVNADGNLISQPLEETLSILSPKLTLELGKAGTFEFSMPSVNAYYNAMRKLKTIITVDLDDTELFRGRVLSHDRDFQNIKKIYVEGDLAYLVDTVQKTEKYEGTTHDLFRKAIAAHNEQTDPEKRFTVGRIEIDDREVIVAGTSKEIRKLETNKFDYEQIAINGTSKEWMTTYDYIDHNIIQYCGGYLSTRRENGVYYIDLINGSGSDSVQEFEFGTNILDISEEATAEEVFTVLIPIGDKNLTIEDVNNGSIELVDDAAVAMYGRIVKTHVFENVRKPATLLENARRFMANHENVPVTFTVKAIDMHLVNKDVSEIRIGDSVMIHSIPHGISLRLICTKIEFDLDHPENNTYTFGNPRQTLTQRYRQDKQKSAGGGGGGGSGGVGDATDEATEEELDNFYDAWINLDPDSAHISLGALYKEYQNGKEILKQQVGIDLDATTGHVNLYALRESISELDGRVTNNSAAIELWANELKSQIDAHVGWAETFEGETNAWHAQLLLEANKNGEAIAALRTAHESRLTALEMKSTELEASVLMKADYDINRQADLQLISNQEKVIAGMQTTYDTAIANLSMSVDSLNSTVVLKSAYNKKIASIEATANDQGSRISALADEIELKANATTINSELVTIKGNITDIQSSITSVRQLIADEIDAVKSNITWLTSKSITVTGLRATAITASSYIDAPTVRMNGNTVATQTYVNNLVANYATQTWVSNQDYATKYYVNNMNGWGSSSGDSAGCRVGGSTKWVSLSGHTHSEYCTESDVKSLISAAISDMPLKRHRHSYSFSRTLANGHTHKYTSPTGQKNTLGVSTNSSHKISVDTYTGYAGQG